MLMPALPLGELGGRLRRWAKGGAKKDKKYNYVVQKVTNVHQEKIMIMMKVHETHVHAVYEKMEVRHYFRFAAKRVNKILKIFFFINFNCTCTR